MINPGQQVENFGQFSFPHGRSPERATLFFSSGGQVATTQVLMRVYFSTAALIALLAVPASAEWSRALEDVLERAKGAKVVAPQEPREADNVATDVPRAAGSLGRLQAIRPMIEQVFREEGVPEELLWLGQVESGYKSSARSPKNAAGVWQLIPETARRFGLTVNAHNDERFETEKATRAAARYLRFLHQTFGDWKLSLAAYNAGEGRVQWAIDRAGSRDFRIVAERLPRETREYVPAVLAAQMAGAGSQARRLPVTTARRIVLAPFSLAP